MLVKTVMHEFVNSKDSYSPLVPSRSLVNVMFDKVAYDYAYDGSKMAYGSTLMANIPGWYRVTGAHFWGTTGYFGTATPLVGNRNLCFQVNSSGRMYSVGGRIMSPVVSDAVRYVWAMDPALSKAGSTAVVQPVKAADEVYLNRGDYVEMFAGQTSGNALRDYVVNAEAGAAGQSAAGFSAFMAATWIRG
jgi:hypothetical protein